MRVLVLDTGPLYDYVTATYQLELPGPMPITSPFHTRGELADFREFVRSHNKRLTVPGVAVELWGLFSRNSDARRAAILWKHHVSQMRALEIEEHHVPVETDVDTAASDGPVDVALCALAREQRGEHAVVTILTIEQRHVLKWRTRSESNVMTLLQVLEQIRSDR